MLDRFLSPYSEDDHDLFESLLHKAYKNYPYTIISVLGSYEEYIQEKNYFRDFRCYLDFFEISVQYLSSMILNILKQKNIQFDEQLQEVSAKIFEKELSTGDWINSIFIVLLKKANILIPDDKLLASLSDLLFDSKGNIFLGWSNRKGEEYKSLPYFRNTVKIGN